MPSRFSSEDVDMLTRRAFLSTSAGVVAAVALNHRWALARVPPFETPLPIPELIDARNMGGALTLTAARGRHAFLAGKPTDTYGFSAPYLGPVLRLRRGEEVEITVENKLDMPTSSHWHGLLVPAAVDGGPHRPINPGDVWRPVLKIDQPETTAWFHAHPHLDTGRQVYMGLVGMIIVEDGTGERLDLPRNYGVDDFPIILQDRQLDNNGALVYNASGPSRMMGMRGDTLTANGAITPFVNVPPGLVRLRILNAANARNFDLRFADGRSFQIIASDGGYLSAPVAMTALTISPGERFEILVDFADGKPVVLETSADNRLMMGGGMMGMMDVSPAGSIMRFDVHPSKAASVTLTPKALVALTEPDPGKAVQRRRFTLDMGPGMMGRGGMGGGMGMGASASFGINGRPFAMDRIDAEPKLGTSEIWEVVPSMMAHPFHVHGVIFRVLSLAGKTPPAHLAGGKDTILLDGPAELLLNFTQPATPDSPFMFHCHILAHEDGGLMAQYRTV
jgi:blue copper oxidase